MATTQQRIIAMSGAIMFFLSIIGVTVVVIATMIQENNQKKNPASQTANTQPKEGQLQGTKLSGFEPVTSVTELQTIDLQPGTGQEAAASSRVQVDYTGAVAATGVIFQSSKDSGQPVSFNLNEVIKGWTDGVPGMKEGGIRRLVIPAELAYGPNPPEGSNIPANAPLVFDITLLKVEQ